MAAVILGAHAIVPRPSSSGWAVVDRAGHIERTGRTYRDCLARVPADTDRRVGGEPTGEG
jgi:hypothetical protein